MTDSVAVVMEQDIGRTSPDSPIPLVPPGAKTVQQYLDEVPRWDDGTPLARAPKTPMQQLVFALASSGKLFEGLVVFMTGMALPLIVEDLQLTASEAGVVSATSLAGILCGALFLGNLSDRVGRKLMFITEMVIFTCFLVGICFATDLYVLLFCLFGMGLALGCDYPTAHLMLSETMSSRDRSRTVLGAFAFQAVGAVVGAVVAVAVLSLREPSVSNWRVMFGLVVVPALAVTIGRLFVVQSPHWLITVGRTDEARSALATLLRRDPRYPHEVDLAVTPMPSVAKGRYRDLFKRGRGGNLRATVFASVPWFLQDLSTYGIGIFTPVIIAATIGGQSGAGAAMQHGDAVEAVTQESLVGAEGAILIDSFLVIGILVAIRYVDRVGSVRMQAWGFLGCAAGLAIAAIGNSLGTGAASTTLIFLGFMTFTFMTNAGPNAQTYLISGEVFPTAVRGTGSGFAAACGKVGAVLTAFLFPILLNVWGTIPILLVLIGCSVAGAVVTWVFRIDTTGKDLESVHNLYEGESAAPLAA